MMAKKNNGVGVVCIGGPSQRVTSSAIATNRTVIA